MKQIEDNWAKAFSRPLGGINEITETATRGAQMSAPEPAPCRSREAGPGVGCGVGCFPGLFLGILTRRARFELPVSPSVFRPLFFFFFFEVGAAFGDTAVPRDGDGPHIANEAAAPESTERGGGAVATPRTAWGGAAASPRATWGGAAASASFVAFTPSVCPGVAQESFVDTAETG